MAILLANADGTVYHRYGGRSDVSPMNIETLIEIMEKGLETHQNHRAVCAHPKQHPALKVNQLVSRQLKDVMKPAFGCIHCHYVREAKQYAAMETHRWDPDQFWIWPSPKRVGLIMNQERQYEVQQVVSHSAADKAGIEAGDHLLRLGRQPILTKYDIQWMLNQTHNSPTQLPYILRRDQKELKGNLQLDDGWKVGDPNDYLWRVRNVFTEHMTKFLPTPGFIGNKLTVTDVEALQLPKHTFALKINQVNHGSFLAGIRLGDVVLSANGQVDFADTRDFFHWCEMQRRSGRDIQLQLIRSGNPMNLRISLEHLNYSRVDKAPHVDVGFIIKELAGDRGLRVGHVDAGSSAAKTGLQIGDRIISVDGQKVGLFSAFQSLLNQKSPGDLLLIFINRDGRKMQFSYHLPGQEERRNEVALLSERVTKKNQQVTCAVHLSLPKDKHIYSMHQKGFGLPTTVEFRGTGYQLLGPTVEPKPKPVLGGIEPMWILEGNVSLVQEILVTDPESFFIQLDIYAQICDDRNCHELRASVYSDGSSTSFYEFTSDPDKLPKPEKIKGRSVPFGTPLP